MELVGFAAEAQTMRREDPLKFAAVERDVERLRIVEKLFDPRQLDLEVKRHAALLDAEKDGPTARRLYTRTLALSTLALERDADLWSKGRIEGPAVDELRCPADPTTVPFPLQQAVKPRPLPVLRDFEDEQSTSPLGRRVHRLELSFSPLVRVRDELDTDPSTDPPRDRSSDVFKSLAGARAVAGDRTAPDVRAQGRARALPQTERSSPIRVVGSLRDRTEEDPPRASVIPSASTAFRTVVGATSVKGR